PSRWWRATGTPTRPTAFAPTARASSATSGWPRSATCSTATSCTTTCRSGRRGSASGWSRCPCAGNTRAASCPRRSAACAAGRWAERFGAQVLRLPGLFGPGLKKNAVYDLLHGYQVEKIHPDSTYQFYDVRQLWPDAEKADRAGIRLLHLSAEPLSMHEIAS